jgi:hypothetical protein
MTYVNTHNRNIKGLFIEKFQSIVRKPLSLPVVNYATSKYNNGRKLCNKSMSQTGVKLRLEDLDIKSYLITKLKMAGIESVFDLAISIPRQLIDVGGSKNKV